VKTGYFLHMAFVMANAYLQNTLAKEESEGVIKIRLRASGST